MKYERYNMDLEDDISAQMMNILANTKAKKKKGMHSRIPFLFI